MKHRTINLSEAYFLRLLCTYMIVGSKNFQFSDLKLHLSFLLADYSTDFQAKSRFNQSCKEILDSIPPLGARSGRFENGVNYLPAQIARQLRFMQGKGPRHVKIQRETIFFYPYHSFLKLAEKQAISFWKLR